MAVLEQELVGREAELGLLSDWVEAVAAGRGRAVLFEGEPGIGKSALLRAAQSEAVTAGCAVFWAAGEELGHAFPLLPVLQAFAFRPKLSEPAAAAEELLDLVDRLCARSPVLLVVDDLHWADAATVALCHRLAAAATQLPLLLIGAMRPVPGRQDLLALRRKVGRDGVTRLAPLSEAAVGRLVANLAGVPPGPELTKLATGAAGNPLYVTELVDALDRGGGLVVAGDGVEVVGGPAPPTLHEAIDDRLDFLPHGVREVLQACALLGREFAVDDLAVVSGRRAAELVPLLTQAHAAGVLTEAGTRMAFRHPLIRAALYDALPRAVRAAWHRDAARALCQAGAPADQVARQLLPATTNLADDKVPIGDWLADWLVESAQELVGEASQAAVELLRPTVAKLPASDARRHRLVAHLARALAYQAEYDEAERSVGRILHQVTDPAVLVDLYDTLVSARVATMSGLAETLADLDRLLPEDRGLPDWARLRLRTSAARLEIECRDPEEVEVSARQTLAAAVAAGDHWATGWMCVILERLLAERGEVQEPREFLAQGLAATDGDPGLVDLRLLMLLNLAVLESNVDRHDRSHAALVEGRLLAERSGKRRRAVQFQRFQCHDYYELGNWDEALAEADLPEDMDEPLNQRTVHHVVAIIAFHRGDPATAKRRLAAARRLEARIRPHAQWIMTTALEREVAGDPRAALDVLSAGLLEYSGQLNILPWLADAARLGVESGDRQNAAAATAEAEALAAAAQVPSRAATAALCRGILDADPQLVLHAADGFAEAGRPLEEAQAQEAAADLLAKRGDLAAARAPFIAALDRYAGLGAEWDITRMRTRFRRYGLRPPSVRRRRPATGWDSLTAAEAKVAGLAARGLSNPEIGEQLGVSRRTAETHLTRVLAKLQLRSRVDLARAAAIRG